MQNQITTADVLRGGYRVSEQLEIVERRLFNCIKRIDVLEKTFSDIGVAIRMHNLKKRGGV